ncbi:MAG: type IV pilus secretin PilQ [Thermodesulfovibrionales bacterium]
MRKGKRHIIFFLIWLIIFFGGCATGGQAKKDSPGSELTIIKDINIADNRIEIKGDRPFVYTAYKPADPFRVVVEIPEADIGKFKDPIKSTSRGITELMPSQIESPKPIARVEILLDTPVSFEQSYHNNVLTLNLKEEMVTPMPAAEVKAAVYQPPARDRAKEDIITVPSDKEEVVVAQNRKDDLSTKEMTGVQPSMSDLKPLPKATEIKDIRLERVKGTLKLIITGNGSMSPSIFTLKNRIVIDIPDVTLKASLPSDFISPIKNIRAGKHKDKTRIVLDMKELKDFDAVSIKDSILLTLGTPEVVVLKEEPIKAEVTKKEPETRVAEAAQPEALVEGRYTGKKISLDFQDADIVPIFRLLADISGYNIVVDPNVKGKLTMKLINVPWDQTLDIILKTFNLGKTVEGNIIRIAPLAVFAKEAEEKAKAKEAEAKAEPLETKIFPISYADVSVVEKSIKDSKILSARGSISVDKRTSSMVVKDVPSVFPQIENLLATLDKPTPQVLIEARIVEINTNDERDLGIQWGLGYKAPNTLSQIGGFSGLGTGTFTGNNFVVDFPAAISGRGSGITFGLISPDRTLGLDLQISALETVGKGKVISNPKILTVDNGKAKILQGKSIPVRKLTTEGTISTEFKDINIELNVQPHITPDKSIGMSIEIKKEELDPTVPSIEGVPGTDKKEANTNVIIRDGETIVIAGMYKVNTEDSKTGVPGLMRLPILGWLFKQEKEKVITSELLIFITPRIVEQPAQVRGEVK